MISNTFSFRTSILITQGRPGLLQKKAPQYMYTPKGSRTWQRLKNYTTQPA